MSNTTIREDALALCQEIEKLPASAQQTALAIRASALLMRINALTEEIDKALWPAVGAREHACDLRGMTEEAMGRIKAAADMIGVPQTKGGQCETSN